MQGVTAERRIVLLQLNLLLRKLLIASGHVAGGAFAFLPSFGALNDNGFASHGLEVV